MKTPGGRAAALSFACAAAFVGSARAAEIADGVTLSGDLRVRHESVFQSGFFPYSSEVDHARMRLRVALGATLDENWDLGLRLATGGGTTSTNQDLDAFGDKAEFYIDRAFARYRGGGARSVELLAGRMPNPYVHSMMLWDSDYNPDGLAEKLVWRGTSADFFLNAGQHVLAEESMLDSNYGITFYALQPGLRIRRGSGTLTVAAAYYLFEGAAGVAPYGNVPVGSDYAVADVYASWKAETAGGRAWGVWADAVVNPEADDHNSAFGAGVSFGSARGKGSGKLSLSYMSIDENAIWINLGDANFSSRLTTQDMQGFVLGAAVGVGEKATLGATWYYKDSRDTDAHEEQLEIDLVLKF